MEKTIELYSVEGELFSDFKTAEKYAKVLNMEFALGGYNRAVSFFKVTVDSITEDKINKDFDELNDFWKTAKIDHSDWGK